MILLEAALPRGATGLVFVCVVFGLLLGAALTMTIYESVAPLRKHQTPDELRRRDNAKVLTIGVVIVVVLGLIGVASCIAFSGRGPP